jgi:hypothetical protein
LLQRAATGKLFFSDLSAMTKDELSHFQSLLSPGFHIVELESSLSLSCNDSLVDREGDLAMLSCEDLSDFPYQAHQESSERSDSPLFVPRDIPEVVNTSGFLPSGQEVESLNTAGILQPTVEDANDDEGLAQGQTTPSSSPLPSSDNPLLDSEGNLTMFPRENVPVLPYVSHLSSSERSDSPIFVPREPSENNRTSSSASTEQVVDVHSSPGSRSSSSEALSTSEEDLRRPQRAQAYIQSRHANLKRGNTFLTESGSTKRSKGSRSRPQENLNALDKDEHFNKSCEVIAARFGRNTRYRLKPSQIKDVIEVSDHLLRDDSRTFIASCLNRYHRRLWKASVPHPPFNGSSVQNIFRSLNCAEILAERTTIDSVRLRQSRLVLSWYYEDMCQNPSADMRKRFKRGKSASTVALDILQAEYSSQRGEHKTPDWVQCRTALQRHLGVGSRWNLLTQSLGFGVLLICSPNLAAKM